MSDAGAGMAAIAEGAHSQLKDLERLSAAKLEELQRKKMEERISIGHELLHKTDEVHKIEESLIKKQEEVRQREEELNQLRARNKVELSSEDKGQTERVTGEVISKFIVRKRRAEISGTTIDVRFLPGSDNASSDIRIGGEGAGSLLARFEVHLDKQVSELAIQAAKYWGLDPNKVFFLDRNHRIVPDSMTINEIVFPGDAEAPSSSSTAPSRDPPGRPEVPKLALSGGQVGASPARLSTSSALAQHGGAGGGGGGGGGGDFESTDLVPVMEGRNYVLTLVRAGTVLDREDLTAPRGKAWADFTFEQGKLEQELDKTRKHYGDTEKVADRLSLDDIPSLFELRELGLKRTKMKHWDTRCRVFEFVVFFASQILFFLSLGFFTNDVLHVRLISEAVEETYLHLHDFEAISNVEEYDAYLRSTFRHAVVTPAMNNSNLYVLGTVGYMYEGVQQLSAAGICSERVIPGEEPMVNGSNETANVTATGTTAAARLLYGDDLDDDGAFNLWPRELQAEDPAAVDLIVDLANGTHGTNGTVAPATGNVTGVCTPAALQRCPNERVVEIFRSAISRGHQYPVCEPVHSKWDVSGFLESIATPVPFSFISGEVTVYPIGIPFQIDTDTLEGYDASIDRFAANVDADGNLLSHAKLIVLFVYSPDLNAVLIFQLLTEHTLSGALINTIKKTMITLAPIADSELTIVVFVLIFSLVVLLMEIRRILGCPRRCFYEREMDRFSIWTIPFLITPALVLGILALQIALDNRDPERLLQLEQNGHISTAGIDNLFNHTAIINAQVSLQMSVLVLQNFMLWRYILGFFPQLSFVSSMMVKISKFLLFVFFYLALGFTTFGVFMAAIFASNFYEFHNVGLCLVNTMRMLLGGGLTNWHDMYMFAPAMWTFVVIGFFCVFMLFLNNIAVATLFSHKKEKDLYESATISAFWLQAKSEMTKSLEALKVGDRIRISRTGIGPWKPARITKVIEMEGGKKPEYEAKAPGFWKRPEKIEFYERLEEFNPAKGGWDFTDIKNPKPPAKPIGL